MNHKTERSGIFEWLAYRLLIAALFILKILFIPGNDLPENDSVKSFVVATEIANGNFHDLHRHVSPGFNLFLAAQIKLFSSIYFSKILNSALMVLAAFLFSRFISRELKLKVAEGLLLFALIGSSLSLTFMGRNLTFEAISTLFYVLFLQVYYEGITQNNSKKLYLSSFLYAMVVVCDYKAYLLLPIILVLEFYRQKNFNGKQLLACGALFLGVLLFFSLLGGLLGLPWYHYFVVAVVFPLKTDDHPSRDVGFFNLDLLYYFKYLFFFENPLVVVGLLLSPFALKLKTFLRNHEVNLAVFLCFFAFLLILGMSIIQKAPRGILYGFPIFYVITFIVLLKYVRSKYLLGGIILLAIGFNIYSITKNVYPYTETNYAQIGSYLKAHNASKITVTVGTRITPHLAAGTEIKQVMKNADLAKLKEEGCEYLLVDDYYKLTGIELDLAPFKNVVLAVKEPTLLNPVLGLEHCEFAGFSFREALEINEALQKQETHLRLVRL